ncbi:hypothetical protein ACQB60_31920 [Actinomycetota bacterium Odt1-20B]
MSAVVAVCAVYVVYVVTVVLPGAASAHPTTVAGDGAAGSATNLTPDSTAEADDIVPGDTNGTSDVFVRRFY